jgi:sugar lactone lactonase YvrE
VVINPAGYVISCVSGEGKRDVLEHLIEQVIQEHQEKGTINFQELSIVEKQRTLLVTPLAFPGKVLATTDNLFIADSGHHRIVVSTLDGEIKYLIGTGGKGFIDGSFIEAEFCCTPREWHSMKKNQLLYVADTENHALRRIDLKNQIVETIAGTGETKPQYSSSWWKCFGKLL